MTEDEFRAGLNAASLANQLFWVKSKDISGIAVGLDSGRGVAILHPNVEVPLSELEEDGA